MAIYIAVVRSDGDSGYTASFPDFPGCNASAPSVSHVVVKAREALLAHVERLLEANQMISSPTAAEAIDRGDALLVAAVDVPDDLRIAHVELAIPALSLARIDSFAQRHGLMRATLFVEAINRWAMQEIVPRERRAEVTAGPTLFDFGNPPELKVEAIAASVDQSGPATIHGQDATQIGDPDGRMDDITAELVRLLEESTEPELTEAPVDDGGNSVSHKGS
jgi:predicted RNase H-like HicB family nuclease